MAKVWVLEGYGMFFSLLVQHAGRSKQEILEEQRFMLQEDNNILKIWRDGSPLGLWIVQNDRSAEPIRC